MADVIDLARLERLCQEASSDPWVARVAYVDNKDGFVCHAGTTEDADLIAAARTALPAILGEVRRLQAIEAAVAELRAADEAWLRRHPHYQRPKGVVLPHDKLYALLDTNTQKECI